MVSTAFSNDKITVAGTGDGQEVFEILARAFEKTNPSMKVEIPPSIDSGGGIRAAASGKCDLGRVARTIREKEKKYNLNYRLFAHAPVAMAANESLKEIEDLKSEDVFNILSGKFVNWSEAGGPDQKIYIVQREKGDAAHIVLEKTLKGFKNLNHLPGYVAYSALETIEAIKKHPGTIGYGALQDAKKAGLHIIKVDGFFPSNENIQNKKYKFAIPLGFVWKGELKGLAKKFFDFTFSNEGKEVLIRNGAVPAL